MRFHVLCGLPRSGSTLLANVLDQHPMVHVSPTSALPAIVAACSLVLSRSPEVKSELIRDRAGTEERMRRAVLGLVRGWYADYFDRGLVVVDKSRVWNHHLRLFEWLFPDGKMVVLVRDLRDIIASIEKQHARTGIFDDADTPAAKTLMSRANALFAADGLVGLSVAGVEDIIRRNPECAHALRYEDLCADPISVVGSLHDALGLEPFVYDYAHVENTTGTDVDGLYLNKFPHQGTGQVAVRESDWKQWIDADLAAQIQAQFPGYHSHFSYPFVSDR